MADYIARNPTTKALFLIRRADSHGHALQLLSQNVAQPSADFELVALAAGTVAPIPPFSEAPPAPAPEAPTPPAGPENQQ